MPSDYDLYGSGYGAGPLDYMWGGGDWKGNSQRGMMGMDDARFTRYADGTGDPGSPSQHQAVNSAIANGLFVTGTDRTRSDQLAQLEQGYATGHLMGVQGGANSRAKWEGAQALSDNNYQMLAAGVNPLARRRAMMAGGQAGVGMSSQSAMGRAQEIAQARAMQQEAQARQLRREMAMQGLDLDARKAWRGYIGARSDQAHQIARAEEAHDAKVMGGVINAASIGLAGTGEAGASMASGGGEGGGGGTTPSDARLKRRSSMLDGLRGGR